MSKQAFSLIELMIVITIIGILAAVAVPAYQGYVIRSKISEAYNVINGLKPTLIAWHAANGTFPANFAELGLPTNYFSGSYVDNTNTDTYGRWDANNIRVTVRIAGLPADGGGNGLMGLKYSYNPATGVTTTTCGTWDAVAADAISIRYLPPDCHFSLYRSAVLTQ